MGGALQEVGPAARPALLRRARGLALDPGGATALVVVIAGLGLFVVVPVARVLGQPGPTEWVRVLTDARYLRLAANTGLIALLSTLSAVAVGFLFAYATSRPDVPGRALFRVVALLPLVSPPFVGGLAYFRRVEKTFADLV